MSLVHEALQKAEREKQRKVGAASSAPLGVPAPRPAPAAVVQASPAIAPATPTSLQVVTRKPQPVVEGLPRTNHFLLPALLGCVAIVAIIAIVFLVTSATSALRTSKESPAPSSLSSTPLVAKTPEVSAQSTAPTGPNAAHSASPAAVPAGDESKYKLSGIMKDPDGKYVAVLNGRIAYEGYYIDGATVKKIESNYITIDVSGREQVLRLF